MVESLVPQALVDAGGILYPSAASGSEAVGASGTATEAASGAAASADATGALAALGPIGIAVAAVIEVVEAAQFQAKIMQDVQSGDWTNFNPWQSYDPNSAGSYNDWFVEGPPQASDDDVTEGGLSGGFVPIANQPESAPVSIGLLPLALSDNVITNQSLTTAPPTQPTRFNVATLSPSSQIIAFIKDYEKWCPVIYYTDPKTLTDPTIAWGHSITTNAEMEKYKNGISQAAGDLLFLSDLKAKAVDLVKQYVKVPLTQAEFDTLVDFTYNEKPHNLQSLLKSSGLNQRFYDRLPARIKLYNKQEIKGKYIIKKNLTIRRTEESDIWINGAYNSAH